MFIGVNSVHQESPHVVPETIDKTDTRNDETDASHPLPVQKDLHDEKV